MAIEGNIKITSKDHLTIYDNNVWSLLALLVFNGNLDLIIPEVQVYIDGIKISRPENLFDHTGE